MNLTSVQVVLRRAFILRYPVYRMSYYLTNGCSLIGSAILGGIICFLIYSLTQLRLYKLASKFRGPPGIPLLGNALDFLGSTEDIMNKWMELSKLYSSPFRIWMGPVLLIFVSHPEHIKKVLNNENTIERSNLYRFFRPWMGNGLLSAPVSIWRVHRKIIGPTFNLKILESYVSIFAAQSRILVESIESKVNGPEFEISDNVTLCTLDIICETAMGVTMEAQTKNDRSYLEALHKAFSTVYERIFKVWLHPDAIFERTQLGKDQKKSLEILQSFTEDVIRKKTETLYNHRQNSAINEKNDTRTTTWEMSPPPRRKVYLDLLMGLTQDDTKFSNLELREEVDTMMVAGSDTTSHTICFIMLMLASHQDVQETVYQELCEIYGNYDIDERSVTYEDLPRMSYLERVIKETLRLFPITVVIARTAMEDLEIDEYTLPKGCTILVSILPTHRNEKYWTEPLKFDPDRFLPEEIAKRDPYCYLPFSAGPRNCIGARFAMMEMKTILATVLRKYRLQKDNVAPVGDIRLRSDSLITPVEPITLRIERRLTTN